MRGSVMIVVILKSVRTVTLPFPIIRTPSRSCFATNATPRRRVLRSARVVCDTSL